MGIRDKYKKQRQDVYARAENHDEDARSKKSWGNVVITSKLPERMRFLKVKEGKHIYDFIPFLAGKTHPKQKEGTFIWTLELFVHQNVGVGKESFVCPSSTWGDPCPICQYEKINNIRGDAWKQFDQRVKKRSLFLIWDRTTPEEEEKGVQLWDVSKFFMKDKLDILQQQGDKIEHFFDPDVGKHVIFTRKGSGYGNTEFLGHSFRERKDIIPDYILEQADWAVDEAVKMKPTFEEIYEAFFGEPCEKGMKTLKGNNKPSDSMSAPSQSEEVQEEASPTELDESIDNIECPAKGGGFGVTFNEFKMCDRCELWEDCEVAFDAGVGVSEPEPEPEPESPKRSTRRTRRTRTVNDDVPF